MQPIIFPPTLIELFEASSFSPTFVPMGSDESMYWVELCTGPEQLGASTIIATFVQTAGKAIDRSRHHQVGSLPTGDVEFIVAMVQWLQQQSLIRRHVDA